MQILDLVFTRKYVAKDGAEKKQYKNMGTLINKGSDIDAKAISIKLDMGMLGEFWLSAFPQKARDNSAQLGMSQKKPYEPSPDDF